VAHWGSLALESTMMKVLLTISRTIDALNERIGRTVLWLVLVMALVSSSNAVARYLFNLSSNAWLELQWYLFAAVFLLCAGYTLLHNEHIRIDVVSSPGVRARKQTRYTFPAGCASAASGAARRPPAITPRKVRRSITR